MSARYRRGMRTVALAALLAVTALAAAGVAAARDPNEPQQRHTAADTKLARSIALTLADLGSGWTKAPPPKSAPPCTSSPDESALVQTARIDPVFLWQNPPIHLQLGSEVDVFRSVREAKRDWRLSTLAVIRSCLFEAIRRDLKDARITVHASQRLPGPKLGERSLHYRLVFDLRSKTDKAKLLPVFVELIGVGVGRTSVVLHALSQGAPLPQAGLHTLSAKLAKRLVSASGGI